MEECKPCHSSREQPNWCGLAFVGGIFCQLLDGLFEESRNPKAQAFRPIVREVGKIADDYFKRVC